MSETVSTRPDAFLAASTRIHRFQRLPIGYGLLLGAVLSVGLWAGLIAVTARLFA